MRTCLECLPCFVRQTLDALQRVTDDTTIHETVLRRVLAAISEMDLSLSPPRMAQIIHQMIREQTGPADPYEAVKQQSNQFALNLLPELRETMAKAEDAFETAIRLAIAGNIIDLGAKHSLSDAEIHATIDMALQVELPQQAIAELREEIAAAKTILYLGDNAGEIVFDRLLLEQLPCDKVTFAVRGYPVINDATMVDAETASIPDLVPVIDNGSDVPGTALETCSESFLDVFNAAELVIAKGQGNYETLNDVEKNIFFLFKVKCGAIARDAGYPEGAFVIKRGKNVKPVCE